MNSNEMLGWSITILAITGLIVLIRLRKKRKEQKILAPLHAYAAENNTEIGSYDWWDKTLIGIDKNEPGTLFFIRNIPGRNIREQIQLSEVSNCRLYKTERRVKFNKEIVNVMDQIEVVFSFFNKRDVSLEFYNADYDLLTLSGELQMAQKWSGMINDIVQRAKQTGQVNKASREEKDSPDQVIAGPQYERSKAAIGRRVNRRVEKESAI
jgi:hypothetical protein